MFRLVTLQWTIQAFFKNKLLAQIIKTNDGIVWNLVIEESLIKTYANYHNLCLFFLYIYDATEDQWIECSDFGGLPMVAEGLQNKDQIRKRVGVNRPNTLRWFS